MDSLSPLEAISAKEAELRRRLETAQAEAEAEINAARTAAKQLVEQAEAGGKSAAESRYQEGLNQAGREAEAIVAKAQTEAKQLRQTAETHLDNAARRLVELVISTGLLS